MDTVAIAVIFTLGAVLGASAALSFRRKPSQTESIQPPRLLTLTDGRTIESGRRPLPAGPVFAETREQRGAISRDASPGWHPRLDHRSGPLPRRCDLGRLAAGRRGQRSVIRLPAHRGYESETLGRGPTSA